MTDPTPERGDVSGEPTAEGLTCDFYDRPDQDCMAAGPAVVTAEGLCGPCAVRMIARAEAAETERDDLMALAVEDTHRRGVVEAERDDLRAALDRVKATDFVAVLRAHLPRDRYRDDGEAIGTYCTCGGWTGDYFADGEAGPFDDHLADVIRAAVEGGRPQE